MNVYKRFLKRLDYGNMLPYLKLLIAITTISTASTLIKISQETVPFLTIATYRLVLSSLLLLPVMVRKKVSEIRRLNSRSIRIAILSGIFLALHFAAWIFSLTMTNVISSVVLVTTTPIWVSALSPILLQEKLDRKFYLGLSISIIGVLIISLSAVCTTRQTGLVCTPDQMGSSRSVFIGNIFALLGAFFAAGYLISGRMLRKKLSNISYISLVYSFAGIFLLLVSLILKAPLFRISGKELIVLFAIALIPQLIGHSLINSALVALPAAFVSIFLLGEPVGSAILALIVLNETPVALECIGSVVILTGIYFAVMTPKKEKISYKD